MPKCVKCDEIFPPNYTEIIENSLPDNKGEYPQYCVFCRLGVSEVERETEHDSGKYIPYTKEECIRDYKDFLKKVHKSKNVQDILKKRF